jgi:hypothetical protein
VLQLPPLQLPLQQSELAVQALLFSVHWRMGRAQTPTTQALLQQSASATQVSPSV